MYPSLILQKGIINQRVTKAFNNTLINTADPLKPALSIMLPLTEEVILLNDLKAEFSAIVGVSKN